VDWIVGVRWLHVLTAAAWFGEVVTINFCVMIIIVMTMMIGARWMGRLG